MNTLEKQIISFTYTNNLSHLGSCLGLVKTLDLIYSIKQPNEKIVISNGHAHIAHLIVRQKYEGIDPQELLKFGIHCDREAGCDVSTGSLGQGLPIAVGMALANKNKDVYCTISDGECAEGSVWESLRIAEQLGLYNLKVYVIANGYSAYDTVNLELLEKRLNTFFPVSFVRVNTDLPFAKGLEPHYKTMTEDEYKSII